MAFFSFSFMFIWMFGIPIAVHSHDISNKTCNVKEIRDAYEYQIHKELNNYFNNCPICEVHKDVTISIKIGNQTWENSTQGFKNSDLHNYNFSLVLESINELADKMPLSAPVSSTKNVMANCRNGVGRRKRRSRNRRNICNKKVCLQTKSLSVLWWIIRAHPGHPHHHTKTD